jgi:hypothetical protein
MRALALTTALLVLLLAACGGDNGSTDSRPSLPPATATMTAASVSAEALCGATHRVAGTVSSPQLVETSGIAAGRRNADVLWAHNDSGDTARVFAMDLTGSHVTSFELVATPAVDWEAMAVGPGPQDGVSYLYLGDIGDNQSVRTEIVVYRVPEPAVITGGTPASPEITQHDALTLRYPDGAHDAETLLVDPRSGDLIIVTKDVATGIALVFRGDASAPVSQPQTLEQVATIDFTPYRDQIQVRPDAPPLVAGVPHIPTAGDVSADGTLVAIRTYGAVFVWERPDGAPLWEAFAGEPCQGPSAVEQQGEAIAFDASGSAYFTISEGLNAPLNMFTVD